MLLLIEFRCVVCGGAGTCGIFIDGGLGLDLGDVETSDGVLLAIKEDGESGAGIGGGDRSSDFACVAVSEPTLCGELPGVGVQEISVFFLSGLVPT